MLIPRCSPNPFPTFGVCRLEFSRRLNTHPYRRERAGKDECFREKQTFGASRMQHEHVRAATININPLGRRQHININAKYASAKVELGVENPTERSCGKRQVPRIDLIKSEMVI
ncbi:unnamed protein product [Lasius platythorax]|uniref:Uncharacterized protein n=1 Tax=Lasius platythorax TaxID=488582 RepID=A0AAV2NAG6_9HYME